MISRPCTVSSSPRSPSSLDTMAVDDMASAPPNAIPACQVPPRASVAASTSTSVAQTWASPRPNTTRRITTSFGTLNSSPIETSDTSEFGRGASRHCRGSASACGPAHDRQQIPTSGAGAEVLAATTAIRHRSNTIRPATGACGIIEESDSLALYFCDYDKRCHAASAFAA